MNIFWACLIFWFCFVVKLNPCEGNPCLNGGSCSPGVIHHYDYICKCKEHFMGKNCESKSLLLTINQPMNVLQPGVAKQLSDQTSR